MFSKKILRKSIIQSSNLEKEEFFDVRSEFSDDLFVEYLSRKRSERRSEIPPKPSNSSLKIGLKSLSKYIGKDLTRVPSPATFWSEPISFLQRQCECLEYSQLLDQAAQCKSSIDQMAHVAAFSISIYSLIADRTAKSFNPLLNETFEFDRMDDLGWRSMSEQVGHHPPKMVHVN